MVRGLPEHRGRGHSDQSIAHGGSVDPVVDGPMVEAEFDGVDATGLTQGLVLDGTGFQVQRLCDQRWQGLGREDGHARKNRGQFRVEEVVPEARADPPTPRRQIE